MIDLHCHVLPGVDDGPRTIGESVALCREAQAAGIGTIVATPHVSWQYEANDASRIARACDEVRAALAREGVDVAIVPGAEVALTRAMELDDEELESLRLGGGPWLLVEPPFAPSAGGVPELLERVQRRGHRIVIAHPERIPAFQRDRGALEHCIELGMVTSVTAGALGGSFGRTVQRFALGLLRDGLVHDVASDAHGPAVGRPARVADELREAGWASHVDHLCRAVPAALLAGEDPPAPPPPPTGVAGRPDGLLARLRRAW